MKRTKLLCEKCGKYISKSNYSRHIQSCNPNDGHQHINHIGLNCQYCGASFKNKRSLAQHECRCSKNPNKVKNSLEDYNRIGKAWNTGLTKETDERILKASESLKDYYAIHDSVWLNKKHSAETIKLMQQTGGGFREHAGRGKKGHYKGYYCDSTYELAYIIYCLDHNIKLIRNTTRYFIYEYNGRLHKYFPDFITDNGFIEIKGYHTELVDIKLNAVIQAGEQIKILYKQDLLEVFDYIKANYSYKNLTDLYE